MTTPLRPAPVEPAHVAYAVALRPERDLAPQRGGARVPARADALLASARRRWWVVALGTALGLAGAAWSARVTAPVYRATATVRLAGPHASLAGPLGADGVEPAAGTDPLLSKLQVLQSRTFGERVVDAPGGDLLRARAGGAGQLGRDVAARRVQQSIVARPRQGTDVVDVSFDAADSSLAPRAVNLIVDTFRAAMLDQSRDRLRQRVAFIDQRLQQTDTALAGAQDALTRFRTGQRGFSGRDNMAAVRAAYVQTDQRRREMDAERTLVSGLVAQATTAQGVARDEAIRALAAAMSTGSTADPAFDDLYRQLTRMQTLRDSLTRPPMARAATNPDVMRIDAVTAAVGQRLLDLARGRVSGLDARVGALDQLASHSAGELRAFPRVEEREIQLAARVDQFSRTADLLRGEFQRAQIAEAAEGGAVDIIDYASAAAPVGLPPIRRWAFGGLLGTLLGVAGALYASTRDGSIRRRDQIVDALHVPELGLIPRTEPVRGLAVASARKFLPGRRDPDARPAIAPLADLRSATAEAYRMLRTNVLYAAGGAPPRTIAVTSPLPRDGKSTVACNFAVACASPDRRVLLIDGDIRQPVVHRVFGVPRAPGLIDQLVGRSTLAELIRHTAVPGLDLLPAGALAGSGCDGVDGDVVGALLHEAAATYTLVVVDAPPVLLTADAAVLAARCDGVLVVLRAGQTALAAGDHALTQLSAVGARVVGAVLNNPDGRAEGYDSTPYYGAYVTTGV